MRSRSHLIYAVLGLLAVLASGCRNGDSGKAEVTGPSTEERIKKIEQSDMPPQAKAIAISQVRSREGKTAEAMGANAAAQATKK